MSDDNPLQNGRLETLLNTIISNQEETKSNVLFLSNQVTELASELHGDKDTPPLHYRVTQIENNTHNLPQLEKDVTDLIKWRDENHELKKSTTETVIKTIVPWVINAIIFAIAMFVATGGSLGN